MYMPPSVNTKKSAKNTRHCNGAGTRYKNDKKYSRYRRRLCAYGCPDVHVQAAKPRIRVPDRDLVPSGCITTY